MKIAVVLFLLRSALGAPQTPPGLVLYGAAIIGVAYVVRRMSGAGKAKRRRAPPAAARRRATLAARN